MKYEDLVRFLEEEEKTTILSKVWPDFYTQLHEYITELEHADRKILKRHSPEAIMIQYELKNALSTTDKLFNKRIRKIIKLASGRAFSKNPDTVDHDIEHMTPEESTMYRQVLDAIVLGKKNTIEPILGIENELDSITSKDNKDSAKQITEIDTEPPHPRVPEIIENMSDQDRPITEPDTATIPSGDDSLPFDNSVQSSQKTPPLPNPAEVPENNSSTDASGEGKKDLNKEYIVVRILKDVPLFIGTDRRNYMLSSQDVAVLPKVNANALIKRKVAVPVESI